jgi:hypothetical protein
MSPQPLGAKTQGSRHSPFITTLKAKIKKLQRNCWQLADKFSNTRYFLRTVNQYPLNVTNMYTQNVKKTEREVMKSGNIWG